MSKESLIKKLVALARRESNAPTPERRAAWEKAKAFRFEVGLVWKSTGVDMRTIDALIEEFDAVHEEKTTKAPRGSGIGVLAYRLLKEHPEWTHRRIAEEINSRITGAQASYKSVAWYACKARKVA